MRAAGKAQLLLRRSCSASSRCTGILTPFSSFSTSSTGSRSGKTPSPSSSAAFRPTHKRPASQAAAPAGVQLRATLLEEQEQRPSQVQIGKDAVYLTWENGVNTAILTSVLRANCFCSSCRHLETNQRHYDIGLQLSTDGNGPDIEQAQLGTDENIVLEVTWRDPIANQESEQYDTVDYRGRRCKLHHSRYSYNWLIPRLQPTDARALDDFNVTEQNIYAHMADEHDVSALREEGLQVVKMPSDNPSAGENSVCLWDQTMGALRESNSTSELAQFPNFPYRHVVNDNEETTEELIAVLDAFHKYGFFVLQGAPTEEGVVEQIANKLGYVRPTHYGRLFSVKSKKVPESLAYTSGRLGFHTDLPYREDTPSIQMLHCIENDSEGGESTLADGFKAAADLARFDPQSFKMLALNSFVFTWQGKQGVYLKSRKPVIQAYMEQLKMLEEAVHTGKWPDVEGAEVTSFNPSNPSADSQMDPETAAYAAIAPALQAIHLDNRNMSTSAIYDSDLEDGKKLMQAYTRFVRLIESQQSELAFKLRPGEVLFFNNRRCLHGRREFDPSTGNRHLEGCYMDSDLMYSTYQAAHAQVYGKVTDSRFTRPDPSIAR